MHDLPPEIVMVPLPGHTWGHAAVAIDTGPHWLLHAGDAYFYREEIRANTRRCTAGLRMQWEERRSEVKVFCAHDALEFETHQLAAPR